MSEETSSTRDTKTMRMSHAISMGLAYLPTTLFNHPQQHVSIFRGKYTLGKALQYIYC